MNLLRLIKNNWILIVSCLLFSFLTVYPQLVLQYKLATNYKGVQRLISDDELYYLARGNEIIEENQNGNPYFHELKYKPTVQFFFPEYITVKPLALLGFSVTQIYFFYDIFLTFVIGLLTYISFWYLTNSKFLSLSGMWLLIFGVFFFFFNRSVSPQLNFVFFLTEFIFLTKLIKSEGKNGLYFWFSLINFGFLFYVYVYFWTFYFVLLFISGLCLCFFDYKEIGKKLLYILAGGTILGSYYFYTIFDAKKLPEFSDTMSRLGGVMTHFPSGIFIVGMSSIILFLFFILYKKGKILLNSINIFLLSGIFTSAIVVNQHIITGVGHQFAAHYHLPAVYWFVLFVIFVMSEFKSLSNKLSVTIILVLYFAIIQGAYIGDQTVMSIYRYISYFNIITEHEVYVQNYSGIFDWLNKNTNKNDVVYANEDISNYIPAYTHNDVLYSLNGILHFVPDDEVFRRVFINNVFSVTDDKFIRGHIRQLFYIRFVDSYGHNMKINKVRKIFGIEPIEQEYFPQFAVDKVAETFIALRKEKLNDLFHEYRIDYFVWDRNKNPEWNLNKINYLKKVFSNNNIDIYEFLSE